MTDIAKCAVCGEPMPPGEQMFKFHGYSGPCPKPAQTPSTARGDLKAAATALYMAGRWDCANLSGDEQARMWEALRDALGLSVGTATTAGVHAITALSARASAGEGGITAEFVTGYMMAPIGNPDAWPENYANGFNDCAKTCAEQVLHAFGEWEALHTDAPQPAQAGASGGGYGECCDTPAYCSSVRRCTAKDCTPASPATFGGPDAQD